MVRFPSVRLDGDCWAWVGTIDSWGYGRWNSQLAHRKSYEAAIGPIPEGLTLDHLCRNKCCINPDHLDPCTAAENVRRWAATITHCKHGHPFDEKNTYIRPSGQRDCRRCAVARQMRYKRRKRASAA